MYTCPKCNRDNLLADEVVFTYGVYVRYCKQCRNTYQSLRRNNLDRHNEHKKYQTNYHLTHKYGLTIEEYDKQVELQFGGCAICKQPCPTGKKLAVDHDHKTKVVRNLLCIRCNNALGLVNDDENLLWNMLEYLKRHSQKVA